MRKPAQDDINLLLQYLQHSEQLAGSLNLTDLAANQKLWRLQILQLQQQQAQTSNRTPPSQQQQEAPLPCNDPPQDCLPGHGYTTSATSGPDGQQQRRNDTAGDTVPLNSSRQQHAAAALNTEDSPRGQHRQQAAFTLQFPLALSRAVTPFDAGGGPVSALQPQLSTACQPHTQQQQQQQQDGRPGHALKRQRVQEPHCGWSGSDQTDTKQHLYHHQQPQHQQQQQQATLQHQQQQQQQQQQLREDCHPPSRTDHPLQHIPYPNRHTTRLLDALAVAAAAASGDPTAIAQQPGLLTRHTQRNSPAAAAAAAAAPTASPAAAAAAASSPEGSSDSASAGPVGTALNNRAAAEARQQISTGPFRKSELLELADQVGSHVVAVAQAAVEQGQPLSYSQVMGLMQPLKERLQGAMGPPLQEVAGWDQGDVRRMFYFAQGAAARHFGLGLTRFKTKIRDLGIEYWPHRQFDSIIQSLNYLRDRSSDSRDSGDVPGRMLVLHHAWYLVNKHPNLRLDEHPAAAVKKAIHKQSFKQRQRGQGASKDKGVWAMLQTDITASAAPAAAPPSAPPAPAAAAAASSDVETAQMDAAGGAADGVAAQVYEALAVWPPSLHYLAREAAKSLLLPRL